MNANLRSIFCLLACFLTFTAAKARILNVPQDYQTIQTAVDSTQPGDTILIQPGVYLENLTITQPNLLISSRMLEDGDPIWISETVIDGDRAGRVMNLRIADIEGIPRKITIRGLTIRNGLADGDGGGIYAYRSATYIEYVDIIANGASGTGGGMYLYESTLDLRNSRLISNTAVDFDSGLCCDYSIAYLEDCLMAGNSAGRATTAYFEHNCHLLRVAIVSNHGAMGTGGIVIGNVGDTPRTLDHVTICGNTGGRDADANGIYFQTDGGPRRLQISNSIITGNQGYQIHLESHMDYPAILIASYSNIEGGLDGISQINQVQIDFQNSMMDEDPRFVNEQNNDFRLRDNSPCIDAGNPQFALDLDGSRSDMGAYQFNHLPPQVIGAIADVEEDEDCGLVEIIRLNTVFADENDSLLTFRAVAPEQLSLCINDGNLLTMRPVENWNGQAEATIIATDRLDSVSCRFMVRIDPVNDPPSQFRLLSPQDSVMVLAERGIHFSWEPSVDPDLAAPVQYILYLYCEAVWFNDTTIVLDTNALDFNFAGLPAVGFQHGLWFVEAISEADTVRCEEPFNLSLLFPDAVPADNLHPSIFTLQSAFPNPFNSSTTIQFSTGAINREATLRVFDLAGRLVDELWTGWKPVLPGEHSVVWNAEGLPGGIYLMRLESEGKQAISKVVLMK